MCETNAHLEARLRDIEDRLDALQLVISWQLAVIPGDRAIKFLSHQAAEVEDDPKSRALFDLLNELGESVAHLHALREPDPGTLC